MSTLYTLKPLDGRLFGICTSEDHTLVEALSQSYVPVSVHFLLCVICIWQRQKIVMKIVYLHNNYRYIFESAEWLFLSLVQ